MTETTRQPTALEEFLDGALTILRWAKDKGLTPAVPEAAHDAVHDAIAACVAGLDVLADLAAMGTSAAVAEPGIPAAGE